MAEEVINYYCENGGTVYATFLDASKAFDRVMFDTEANHNITQQALCNN